MAKGTGFNGRREKEREKVAEKQGERERAHMSKQLKGARGGKESSSLLFVKQME